MAVCVAVVSGFSRTFCRFGQTWVKRFASLQSFDRGLQRLELLMS